MSRDGAGLSSYQWSCRYSLPFIQLAGELPEPEGFPDPAISIGGIGRIKINFDLPAFPRGADRDAA